MAGDRIPSQRAADLLALDIDLRLGPAIWVLLWEMRLPVTAEVDERLASLLRLAYGRGYYQALMEPRRGQLCADHGLIIPPRQ
jgi:hypothetical protein